MGRVSDGAPHARSPTALTPLLLSTGHYIIITTSRMMDSKHGNVGQVIAACGNATLKTLADLNIPYDEIHFGRPQADLYIDSSVACASVDTEKDVGWRLKTKGEKLADGMVAARHFNTVQLQGDYVVKTSARSVLRGEMFFYSHMPPDISDLFPQLKSSSDDPPKPGDRRSSSTRASAS